MPYLMNGRNGDNREDRREKLKKIFSLGALLVLILLFTLYNYNFIKFDQAPPEEATHTHLFHAYHIHLLQGSITSPIWLFRYPPLQYIATIIFTKLFGWSIPSILWSLFPFCIIYIISLYYLGEHFGGPEGAIASAMIGTATPFFLDISHIYIPDTPQAGMLIMSLLFLIKCDKFRNSFFSYLFALGFALAMLAKWSTIFFLLVPILMEIWAIWKEKAARKILGSFILISTMLLIAMAGTIRKENAAEQLFINPKSLLVLCVFVGVYLVIFTWSFRVQKERLNGEKFAPAFNFIRSVIISTLLFVPYYLIARHRILMFTEEHESYMQGYWAEKNLFDLFIKNGLFQIHNLLSAFPMLLIMLAIGLIFFIMKREKSFDMGLMGSFLIFGFVWMDLITPLFSRYIIALFPVLAVIAGYWLRYAGYAKIPVISAIAAYAILSLSFPFFSPKVEYEFQYPIFPTRASLLDLSPTFPRNPSRGGLHIQDIIADAIQVAKKSRTACLPISIVSTMEYAKARDQGVEPGIWPIQFFIVIHLMDKDQNLALQDREIERNVADDSDVDNFLEGQPGESLIILCYNNPEEPGQIIQRIRNRHKREARVISYYYGEDRNKLALIWASGNRAKAEESPPR